MSDGTYKEVGYDADAPCWSCGLPVTEASMGGTVICPWCDCGVKRDGTQYTLEESIQLGENYRKKLAEYEPAQSH